MDITTNPRRILVTGATGTMGGAVLQALLDSNTPGLQIRVLTRRPFAAPVGVEAVVGDLTDREAVRRALTGVDAAFYVSPHEDAEVEMAQLFVDETRRQGVRIVFAGVHVSTRTLGGKLMMQFFKVIMKPYRPKLAIGTMIEKSCPDAVLISPSNFMDNDLTFVEDIAAGTFPTPLKRVNRIAASDIGAVAARALLDPAAMTGTVNICGPESLTGEQSAAIWSEALGHPVTYTGNDPQAWAQAADRRLAGGKKGQDWRNSYRLLSKVSAGTSAKELQRTTALLGRAPVDFRTWTAQQVHRRTIAR
ncbi:NAD(P)H-binding protein [Nakamurella sp. YIM 132087]|uniref:NAD(P)H-binding protein n=1 Tax=Nakamurella alba TaxID=2665158 RepID=A0A7K1FP29_9ACTN|nr:NmrA family NAD(P)-binding protein [Nakamurella alba]MTD15905.1 NAD(P)H-binding protein [Nakamurella alba]